MSDIALEFIGSKTEPDGQTADHVATVHEPRQNTRGKGWLCLVCCPSLFTDDEEIAGATAAQALRLARLFVLDALERHGVTVRASDREQ